MRTPVVSDLHLGHRGAHDIFVSGEVPPHLIEWFDATPSRLLADGDAVDFLLNEDPPITDLKTTLSQARAIVSVPDSAAFWRAFGGGRMGLPDADAPTPSRRRS